MSSKPLFSICIPTWNRAPWLKRCLQSVRNQPRHFHYELWVRDNASTDDTLNVFDEIAQGDPDWRLIQNATNLGGIANLRLCTERASAPYLMILGSDDAFRPDAFARLHSAMELATRHNASAIFAFHLKRQASCWPMKNGTDWLRHVSMNVPAFISSIIWRTDIWKAGPYAYDPLSIYTLPHLEMFIEACLHGSVIACGDSLVEVGHAEDSIQREDESALYGRWPLMDCFEYPELYRKVFDKGELGPLTWAHAQVRRLAHFRHIPKKMALIQYNWHHFQHIIPSLSKQIKQSHKGTIYHLPLGILASLIAKNELCRHLVESYCKQHLGYKKLCDATSR